MIDYAQNVAADPAETSSETITETKLTRSKAKLLGQQPLLSALETTRPKSVCINIFNISFCVHFCL